MDSLPDLLRDLRRPEQEPPAFAPEAAPENPLELFVEWLRAAVAAGALDPHAMVLSTVAEEGGVDARVVLLRSLSEARWGFATSIRSPKALQLGRVEQAALTFAWPEVGRQVRIRGSVVDAGVEAAREDFLARSPSSRAECVLDRQSDVLSDHAQLDRALGEAREWVDAHPDEAPAHWRRYDVEASAVEFWQRARDRRHVRLRYTRAGAGVWRRELLWP